MDGGYVPPVGMGVDEGEHFLHNRDTSSLRSEDPFAFGSERQGSTLASRLSDTQNCEGSHAPRSFRRANRHNLLIVRTRDQPGFGRYGASGSSCRRSAVHAQQHFEVPEFRPGLSCFNCAVLVLGNCGRRSVAIFPPCASTALQPFGRPRSRGGTSVHPAAGVFPRFHAPHCWTVARQTLQDAAAAAFPPVVRQKCIWS